MQLLTIATIALLLLTKTDAWDESAENLVGEYAGPGASELATRSEVFYLIFGIVVVVFTIMV